jgi:hypothetical protein
MYANSENMIKMILSWDIHICLLNSKKYRYYKNNTPSKSMRNTGGGKHA